MPKTIVELSTLTGACIYSLGFNMAGIFSNNDIFCRRMIDIGKSVNEEMY